MISNQIFLAVCCGWRSLKWPQSIAAGLDLALGMKIDRQIVDVLRQTDRRDKEFCGMQ
jgi:hypothetical protein